jgi:hypothetical protein
MKNKAIGITALFLIISIGNYSRFTAESGMRTVEFVSCFAMGALTGILILQIAMAIKVRKK